MRQWGGVLSVTAADGHVPIDGAVHRKAMEIEVQVVLDHLLGSNNVASDAPSRVWIDKALQAMQEAGIGSAERLELWESWGCWLEDLVDAVGV